MRTHLATLWTLRKARHVVSAELYYDPSAKEHEMQFKRNGAVCEVHQHQGRQATRDLWAIAAAKRTELAAHGWSRPTARLNIT